MTTPSSQAPGKGWILSKIYRVPISVRWAFFACLVLRLIYLGMFGDKMTGYAYEHGFAVQAISLLEGRGMEIHDDYIWKLSEMQLPKIPSLLQPREYPPYPQDGQGYYQAMDMPGYCWVIAGIWKIFGAGTFWPVKIFQALVSVFLLFPIWWMTRQFFDEKSAVWSAWLYAFWLPGAYLSQMISKEAAEGLLMAPACYFLIKYFLDGKKLSLMFSTLLFTLAVFMRTNLLLLPFALCILGMLKFPTKRCVTAFMVCLLFMVACLIPWVLRNKKFVSPEIGVKEGFYWAFIWNLTANDPAVSEQIQKCELYRQNMDGTPRKLFREPTGMEAYAKKTILDHFGLFLKLGVEQGVKGPWQPMEWGYDILPQNTRSFSDFHKATGENRFSYLIKHPFAVLFKTGARFFEISIMALSIAIFWFRRNDWRESLFFATCYGLLLLTYMFVHIESRYLVPHTWSLTILAGACLSQLYARRKSIP